ncbi:hypothetical protein [Streptomyces sp. 8N616]|uniref:hypothetical protein n=1 Tax=Streptomyces sp. 8N616 TaxID=3457414 RepID=UPI003FD66681
MRRVGSALIAMGTALLMLGFTVPAEASTGEVVVFETEINPLTTYENPAGCNKLPLAAHVLINKTDKPVRVYTDPLCLSPSFTVQPGHGSHVTPGSGSFSV